MSIALEMTLCLALVALELFAVWRWGIRGAFDRLRAALVRIIEGPAARPVSAVDHARISQLERELLD